MRALHRLAVFIVLVGFAHHAAPAMAEKAWSATWTNRKLAPTPAGGPGPRGWIDLIHDPVAGKPALFGGSGNTYMNDVLQIDFASGRWLEIEPLVLNVTSPLGPPCQRDEQAVVYDDFNQLYWSFGGSGSGCAQRQSTIGAGSTITKIVDPSLPATEVDFYRDWDVAVPGPNAQYAYVSAYDPATKTLTLATPTTNVAPGGKYNLTSQPGGGTWSYDPARRHWNNFQALSLGYVGAKPAARLSPAFAYSTRDHAAVMFGSAARNDTWALDAETQSWVQLLPDGAAGSPPRRNEINNSMVYDSVNDVFVLFGGRCSNASGCNGVANGGKLADTWIYRVATNAWTRMLPATSPPARNQHTLSFDPVHGVVVLYGGYGVSALNDVWVYDVTDNTWTPVASSPAPGPRYLHAMVYDPVIAQHVVYGGNASSTTTAGTSVGSFALTVDAGNVPPHASFVANPASGPPSTVFAFDGSASSDSDGSIVAYAWSFGDGESGNGSSITHSYAAAGTYSVTLTVTDDKGAAGSATSNVTVVAANVAPIARMTVTPAGPDTFDFNATGSSDPDGTIVSYAWTFGDAVAGAGTDVIHTFAEPGSYIVTLTVTDDKGATGSASTNVDVIAPNVAPTARIGITSTAFDRFDFSGASSSDSDGSIVAYAWDFGDGSVESGPLATHRYATPGNYIVTLTVTDDRGGTGSASSGVGVIAINVAPTARIATTPTAPDTIGFDATGSSDPENAIASYSWNFGDGTTGSGVIVSHRYDAAGTYTVELTVVDAAGSSDVTRVEVSVPAVQILLTRTVRGTVTLGGAVASVTANGAPVAFTSLPDGAFEFTLSAPAPTVVTISISASVTGFEPVVTTFDVAVP